ncbi:hypothetical protein BRC81_01960 [Halobacteriales archaeon QS_1_68_20]|nr:MAG: hypothetical protein BRC81_01960 [Halobacteriales archaeon QS_1_68_20]
MPVTPTFLVLPLLLFLPFGAGTRRSRRTFATVAYVLLGSIPVAMLPVVPILGRQAAPGDEEGSRA